MFCILITSSYAVFFAPRCVGSYRTLTQCEAAIVHTASNVTPETHKGYAFKCVEKGKKS